MFTDVRKNIKSEDVGNTFFPNISKYSPYDTSPCTRRLEIVKLLIYEQILSVHLCHIAVALVNGKGGEEQQQNNYKKI